MNPLFLIGLAPLSWRLGVVRHKPGKLVWALGPIRLSFHDLGPDQESERESERWAGLKQEAAQDG